MPTLTSVSKGRPGRKAQVDRVVMLEKPPGLVRIPATLISEAWGKPWYPRRTRLCVALMTSNDQKVMYMEVKRATTRRKSKETALNVLKLWVNRANSASAYISSTALRDNLGLPTTGNLTFLAESVRKLTSADSTLIRVDLGAQL